jgi:hypothetical protein
MRLVPPYPRDLQRDWRQHWARRDDVEQVRDRQHSGDAHGQRVHHGNDGVCEILRPHRGSAERGADVRPCHPAQRVGRCLRVAALTVVEDTPLTISNVHVLQSSDTDQLDASAGSNSPPGPQRTSASKSDAVIASVSAASVQSCGSPSFTERCAMVMTGKPEDDDAPSCCTC